MQNFFVAGWVNKDSGALGFEFNGEHQPFPLLTRVPFAKPISNVSATLYHTLFLTADGEVYTCGSNVAMRAGGLMNDERILHPTRIEFFNTHKLRVVNCYAFDRGSVFCTSDGSMWYCGRLSTTNLQTAQQLSVHVTRVATSYPSYTHLTFVNYNITILAQDGYVYYKDVDQATKQDLPFTRSTIPNGNIKELYEYRLLNSTLHCDLLTVQLVESTDDFYSTEVEKE
jgi:alpha-tubulin suppressor-like RCC1 family protein